MISCMSIWHSTFTLLEKRVEEKLSVEKNLIACSGDVVELNGKLKLAKYGRQSGK